MIPVFCPFTQAVATALFARVLMYVCVCLKEKMNYANILSYFFRRRCRRRASRHVGIAIYSRHPMFAVRKNKDVKMEFNKKRVIKKEV